MNLERATQTNKASESNAVLPRGLLQRKCECGNHTQGGKECTACSNKKLNKPLQAKLKIEETKDRYEQEADRVAEQVMRMPNAKNSDSNEYLQAKPFVQRQGSNTQSNATEIPSIVHDVLRTSGQPLDQVARDFMESRFGYDFSGVRIHTDAKAAESAQAVNAKAYTVGNNVVFGKGNYSIGNSEGKALLAHELTHVVQQGRTTNHKNQVAQNANENKPFNGARISLNATETKLQRACGPAAETIGTATTCIGESSEPAGDLVLFNVGCDTFLGAGEETIREFADSMADTDTVNVHGFASVDGETDFNLHLSCARSRKAADILENQGILPTQIALVQHGETPGPASERRSVVLERVPGVSRPVVPQLSAVVSAGPTPGICGGMNFVIRWQLSRNSATNGGFVMQDVGFLWDVRDCSGVSVPNPDPRTSPLRYFEAWRVAPNSQNLSPVTTDTFFWPSNLPWAGGCTDGDVTITATARYHDNVPVADMPAHMVANNPATFAGGLRSSLTDPNLRGNISRDVPHSLTFHWVCCPCQSSPTVVDQHTP